MQRAYQQALQHEAATGAPFDFFFRMRTDAVPADGAALLRSLPSMTGAAFLGCTGGGVSAGTMRYDFFDGCFLASAAASAAVMNTADLLATCRPELLTHEGTTR